MRYLWALEESLAFQSSQMITSSHPLDFNSHSQIFCSMSMVTHPVFVRWSSIAHEMHIAHCLKYQNHMQLKTGLAFLTRLKISGSGTM